MGLVRAPSLIFMIPTRKRSFVVAWPRGVVMATASTSTRSRSSTQVSRSPFRSPEGRVALAIDQEGATPSNAASPPMCGLGAEGPVQSNHCEGKGRRVRLSGISLSSKRLVSRQIAGVYTLNATSDGAFAATRASHAVR